MVSQRFNIIEQLQIMSTQKPSKEPSKKKSFDPSDIPNVFRRMYEVADSLASKESLIWVQVKHSQDMIDRMQRRELPNADNTENESLPPLLETQLLDFVNGKREEYMQRMTQLLELCAKSKWDHDEKRKGE